jgi:molybdopterin converting factor small subunit
MTVQLKFFAGLRNYLPEGQSPYPTDVEEGATVGEVLRRFGVPEDKPRILLVNGRHADVGHVLRDGDLVSVFPPVAGG